MTLSDQQQRLQRARAALHQAEVSWGLDARWQQPYSVSEDLAPLFPRGISPGTAVSVQGSTSLMWRVAAQLSSDGQWTALVGVPDAGLLAGAYAGVSLERLALIPHPGLHASDVIRWCLEGMAVVVVGPDVALSGGDQRRLNALARERGAVILALGRTWPEAHLRLHARSSQTEGLGAGTGRLRTQRWTVGVTERRGASRLVPLAWQDGRGGAAIASPPSVKVRP